MVATACAAQAQAWPAKSLRLIVPLPSGQGVDALMRYIAPLVAEQLKQPVLVENRPGAAGNIGMEAVASAATPSCSL